MALLLLRNEADCLVPNMETESVSSHLPPELNRSPLPRERFRPQVPLLTFAQGQRECKLPSQAYAKFRPLNGPRAGCPLIDSFKV